MWNTRKVSPGKTTDKQINHATLTIISGESIKRNQDLSNELWSINLITVTPCALLLLTKNVTCDLQLQVEGKIIIIHEALSCFITIGNENVTVNVDA